MSLDELMQKILAVIPHAQFEDDMQGQIIIYTGLKARQMKDREVTEVVDFDEED
jgi:ABC-type lipoprotein release transport system permease subunit